MSKRTINTLGNTAYLIQEWLHDYNEEVDYYSWRATSILDDDWLESDYNRKIKEKINETNKLKQKYAFLDDFMKNERIMFASESEYNESLLEKKWVLYESDWETYWTRYYLVNNKWEIIKVGNKHMLDEDLDLSYQVNGNIYTDKVWDFIESSNSRYTILILENDYSSDINESSVRIYS